MTNVVFVNAPSDKFFYIREGRCQTAFEESLAKKGLGFVPPVLLAQYSSILEKAGHNVKILDCIPQKITKEDSIDILKQFNTDILIINATTFSFDDDTKYAKYVRENLDMPLVAVGPHGTAEPESLLRNGIDIVARGETDFVILDMVNKIGSSKDVSRAYDVRGTSFLNKNDLVNNPLREWINDLGSLPFPARHLLDQTLYKSHAHGRPYTIIRSSRGCPFHCVFCEVGKMFGRKARFRSSKNVVDEIEEIVKKYDIRIIHFFDDLFTASREHVLSICNEIKKRGLEIHWFANTRADFVDLEMMKTMKKAGCIAVTLGIESGSQRILNSARKGARIENFENGITMCKKAGLLTLAYFIAGFPLETKETIEETKAFIRKTKPDAIVIDNFLRPLPGTKIYEIARKKRLIPSYSWNEFALALKENRLFVKTEFISTEEIKKEVNKIKIEFSRSPSFIFHRIKRVKDVGLRNATFFINLKHL